MSQSMDRRSFNVALSGAAAGLALNTVKNAQARSANNDVVVGVMGLSRGRVLSDSFAKQPGVQVKYVCDVDSNRVESCVKLVAGAVGKSPKGVTDFRRILDDKSVDALVCAAPNHWHAPATILGCAAGKHVYVEKPCSHNPREGELMVEASRRYNRAVQVGTQRRSGPAWREAIRKLHAGAIGRIYLVRALYFDGRGSIGHGKPTDVPSHIDYDLWQGPAPRQPYSDNVVHYNWHWRWHWGNGELGNNGVHYLDLCRWALKVDLPTRVTSSGGRYHWDDDQETPDTHTVCYEFGGQGQITWQGNSCNRHGKDFINFYGDGGTMKVASNGAHIVYDKGDKRVDEMSSNSQGDIEHITNFLEAIRNDKPRELNAEIAEGHKSTLICHLGNIAQRTGRTLNCDATNGHILNDTEAMALWVREYEPGWEPRV